MRIVETPLKDCVVLKPKVFEDARGVFYEAYQKKRFDETINRAIDFVQDNYSISQRGVLRGLHFQFGEHAQAKLVQVVLGEVLDVIVDLRRESKTFGRHFKLRLSDADKQIVFIPKGMAHGFLTLSEKAMFFYKCDAYYNAAAESGIMYADNTLNIDWEYPSSQIILSKKDQGLPSFKELFP